MSPKPAKKWDSHSRPLPYIIWKMQSANHMWSDWLCAAELIQFSISEDSRACHTKKWLVRQFFTLKNPSELIELYSTTKLCYVAALQLVHPASKLWASSWSTYIVSYLLKEKTNLFTLLVVEVFFVTIFTLLQLECIMNQSPNFRVFQIDRTVRLNPLKLFWVKVTISKYVFH